MWFRLLVCFFFGHRFEHEQNDDILLTVCVRCRKLLSSERLRYTLRTKVTRGDIERRMALHKPAGYQFVDCNWKKRKAKFVSRSGKLKFISF